MEYRYEKGDRVMHLHNGCKGTIDEPQKDDYVESYWVLWDGWERRDIMEPEFLVPIEDRT